jgi:hypothetical protein
MRPVADFILNPRRAPRSRARCRASVRLAGAAWVGETEDVGPHGCQLLAPSALATGAAVSVEIASAQVPGELRAAGTVAWVSSQPPWRVGVSFSEEGRVEATRWFAKLVAGRPDEGGRYVPDRLPVDAMLFLGPPPRFMVDFTPDEVEVLRHVAGGISVAALRTRLAASWPRPLRALFSLLARQAVTVSRSVASSPQAWKAVMQQLGAGFDRPGPDASQTGRAPPEPFTVPPRPPPAGQPPPAAPGSGVGMRTAAPSAPAPPQPVAAQPAARPPGPAGAAAPGGSAPAATAGTGWRGTGRARSPEAQEALDLGRAELAAGRKSSALACLRRALALSPGDSEVAAELGKAMR